MITWTEAYQKALEITGDDGNGLTQLKADINQGYRRFNAALNRYFTRRAKTTNIVASQQYYQVSPDCLRVIKVRASQSTASTVKYPIRQIHDEQEWDAINTVQQTGNWATFYFVRGADEIGLWPIPADNITNGLEISYEPRDKELAQEDVTTGTATVTNGSTAVTGSGTAFSQAMIGRGFTVTDGTDGYSYKISGYTSATSITLEEPYIGLSGSGKTFKIGETFLIPEEYHDAPIDYAVARYFEQRNQEERATYHMGRYKDVLSEAKALYSSSSNSSVVTEGAGGMNIWVVPPEPITGV